MLIEFLVLILSTFILFNVLYPLFSKYILDKPNKRSSHKKPTPNGGGLIIASLGIPYLYLKGATFSVYCIPLAIISFIDDFIKVDYRLRLLIQGFTVACIYSNSTFSAQISGNSLFFYYLISIIIIFIGTGLINFVNFMDGLDGLLGSSMLLIIGIISIKSNLEIAPFVGIIFGFLIYNWPPAKIFMGDIGSTFFAAILLGLIFDTKEINVVFSRLLITLPLLGDAIFTVFFRLINKQTLFNPHRLHLFQRLNIAGWSHLKVTSLYSFMTMSLSIIYYFYDLKLLSIFTIIIIAIGFLINHFFASPIEKIY